MTQKTARTTNTSPQQIPQPSIFQTAKSLSDDNADILLNLYLPQTFYSGDAIMFFF